MTLFHHKDTMEMFYFTPPIQDRKDLNRGLICQNRFLKPNKHTGHIDAFPQMDRFLRHLPIDRFPHSTVSSSAAASGVSRTKERMIIDKWEWKIERLGQFKSQITTIIRDFVVYYQSTFYFTAMAKWIVTLLALLLKPRCKALKNPKF